MAKLAYSPDEAAAETSFGLARIYQAMNAGELKARKSGKRTVIPHDELVSWLANLPPYERGQWLTPDRSKNNTARRDSRPRTAAKHSRERAS